MSKNAVAQVKITIEVPRPLHAFMTKFANLEGSKAANWYELWIGQDFESFLDTFRTIPDLDVKGLIKHNNLEKTLADRNPSFVERLMGVEGVEIPISKELHARLMIEGKKLGLTAEQFLETLVFPERQP